jgi:hypothetical protein
MAPGLKNASPHDAYAHSLMNDTEIRQHFHQKYLERYRDIDGVRIVDELGLMHGACRADIAVVNGLLVGYEIKSEEDSLSRLERQIGAYDAIFDLINLIVCEKHRPIATDRLPKHWGIIVSVRELKGGIKFRRQRKAARNPNVDPFSLARLLWKSEAIEVLEKLGEKRGLLRSSKAVLYRKLIDQISLQHLKRVVRTYLKKREGWRDQKRPSPNGDLFQPTSKLVGCQFSENQQRIQL